MAVPGNDCQAPHSCPFAFSLLASPDLTPGRQKSLLGLPGQLRWRLGPLGPSREFLKVNMFLKESQFCLVIYRFFLIQGKCKFLFLFRDKHLRVRDGSSAERLLHLDLSAGAHILPHGNLQSPASHAASASGTAIQSG